MVGDVVQFVADSCGALVCGVGEVGDSLLGAEGVLGMCNEFVDRLGGKGLRFMGIDGFSDGEFGVPRM